jgi:hypothetical protein
MATNNIHDMDVLLQLTDEEINTLNALIAVSEDLIRYKIMPMDDYNKYKDLKPLVIRHNRMAIQKYITLMSKVISTVQVTGTLPQSIYMQYSNLLDDFRTVLWQLPWFNPTKLHK